MLGVLGLHGLDHRAVGGPLLHGRLGEFGHRSDMRVAGPGGRGEQRAGDAGNDTLQKIGRSHVMAPIEFPKQTVAIAAASRSETHTYEIQSLMRNSYAVFSWIQKKK